MQLVTSWLPFSDSFGLQQSCMIVFQHGEELEFFVFFQRKTKQSCATKKSKLMSHLFLLLNPHVFTCPEGTVPDMQTRTVPRIFKDCFEPIHLSVIVLLCVMHLQTTCDSCETKKCNCDIERFVCCFHQGTCRITFQLVKIVTISKAKFLFHFPCNTHSHDFFPHSVNKEKFPPRSCRKEAAATRS